MLHYRGVDIMGTGWGPFHTQKVYWSSGSPVYQTYSSLLPQFSSPTPFGLSMSCALPNGTFLEEKITEEELQRILEDKLKKKIDKYLDNKEKLDILGELGRGPETVKDLLDKPA